MGQDLEGERPGTQPDGGAGNAAGDFEMDNDDGWVGLGWRVLSRDGVFFLKSFSHQYISIHIFSLSLGPCIFLGWKVWISTFFGLKLGPFWL